MTNSPMNNQIALVTEANDPEGLGFGIAGELIKDAATVRFLCHPDSSLITGEVLMIDGGWILA